MKVTYHEPKRLKTLEERGPDFEDSAIVFAGPHFTSPDDRFDYGERRWVTVGQLADAMIVMVWTERDTADA